MWVVVQGLVFVYFLCSSMIFGGYLSHSNQNLFCSAQRKGAKHFFKNYIYFQSLRPRCCKKAADRTDIVRLKESKVAFLDNFCYYLGCSAVGGLFRTGVPTCSNSMEPYAVFSVTFCIQMYFN